MKVSLSKYAGFCDGVNRAYDMAVKLANDKKAKKPIFMLGSLVHNNEVVKKIERMGIKKINFDGDAQKFFTKNLPSSKLRHASRKKIGTLVVTAHGIGPDFYKLAKEKNIDIVDTTCPKVMKVQRLAKLFSDRNYQVVIIGEKEHKEVKGIFEWSGKTARIIENKKDLKLIKFDERKIAIISQTTQDANLVKNLSEEIKKKFPKSTEIFDTLCLATHNRQEEVKKLAKNNDRVIIIGSPESANSTNLWKIAKRVNSKSYFIENVSNSQKSWFAGAKSIGISAGASTPPWIIEKVCFFTQKKL